MENFVNVAKAGEKLVFSGGLLLFQRVAAEFSTLLHNPTKVIHNVDKITAFVNYLICKGLKTSVHKVWKTKQVLHAFAPYLSNCTKENNKTSVVDGRTNLLILNYAEAALPGSAAFVGPGHPVRQRTVYPAKAENSRWDLLSFQSLKQLRWRERVTDGLIHPCINPL